MKKMQFELKPFQRILFEESDDIYIVVEKHSHLKNYGHHEGASGLIALREDGWMEIEGSEWSISEVYDVPGLFAELLDHNCYGKLLWKREEEHPNLKRINDLEKKVQEIVEEIQYLKEEMQ